VNPQPLEPTSLEAEIVSALRRIIRAVDLHSRHLTEVAGLTGPQLLALREAERLGPVPIGLLSRAIHLSQPTVTGIVARLEQRSLVLRDRSPGDRRRSLVTVTDAGRRILANAPSLLQDRFRDGLSRLETWEQTMTLATLQRIASMMDAEGLDAAPVLAPGRLVSQEYDGAEATVAAYDGDTTVASKAPAQDATAPAPTSRRDKAAQDGKITRLPARLPSTPSLRPPCTEDAKALWQLVHDLGSLDLNSAYAYLLVGTHFRDTSVIAESGGRIVAFVAGYRPPDHDDTLFVWQIGVAPTVRRRGLGVRMIREVLSRPECGGVRFVEATVTPSNAASGAMFRALAGALHTTCEITPAFDAADFPGSTHEAETLYRIGPIADNSRRR
jgi:L-2,4-diaminobutyric acid acetyltransferase